MARIANASESPPVQEHVEIVPEPKSNLPTVDRMTVESQSRRMQEYFDTRPKVEVRVRKEDGDQVVSINNYKFWIQAGQRVKVPVDVRDILEAAGLI